VFFFDLDGPILDVSDKYYKAYAKALHEIGCSALDKHQYWYLKRNKSSDYDILARTSSERSINEFKKRRNTLIEDTELLKLDFVWPQLEETYERLFSQIPTNLVTLRTYSDKAHWQLKQLGIHSWFNGILSHPASGDRDERWKMKVNLIKNSGILNTIDGKDSVVVGDTETDILAGKYLGFKTIAVSFGIRSREYLLPVEPDSLFDSPGELSRYLQREYL
jgi:phosphoglycolate phosphatase-like HAD superfamily hydrolase